MLNHSFIPSFIVNVSWQIPISQHAKQLHIRCYCCTSASLWDLIQQRARYFYPRNAMLARYLLSLRVRLFVRLSQADVISKQLNIKSQKQCRMHMDSRFMTREISGKLPWDHPQRRRQMQVEVGKNCVFRPVENFLVQMPYRGKKWPSASLVRRPRLRRCAVEWIHGVINNVGGGRRLLIIVTVQLTSTLVVITTSTANCDTKHRVVAVR